MNQGENAMSVIDAMRARNSKSSGESKAVLPRAPTVPAPAPAPYYDEEVLRVAQRDFDNKRLIVQLEGERDDWRRKALAAEAECRRLDARLAQEGHAYEKRMISLAEDRDRKIDELTVARDAYKVALARFETKIGVQGKAVLDLANGISRILLETMDDLKNEKGEKGDVAGSVGLAAIADAIDPPTSEGQRFGPHEAVRSPLDPSDEPLPRAVTAGPAQHGES
jgi:hypothetical protein